VRQVRADPGHRVGATSVELQIGRHGVAVGELHGLELAIGVLELGPMTRSARSVMANGLRSRDLRSTKTSTAAASTMSLPSTDILAAVSTSIAPAPVSCSMSCPLRGSPRMMCSTSCTHFLHARYATWWFSTPTRGTRPLRGEPAEAADANCDDGNVLGQALQGKGELA